MPDEEGLNLSPVSTIRASEAIYEQIKNKILDGILMPGDRLPSERQLMEMLERSRPTIREALRMLEQNGFIKISAGSRGATVMKVDNSIIEQPLETMLQVGNITITELYEFRIQCECAIARWAAARRDKTDIARMETILGRANSLLQSGDYAEFIHSDPIFHTFLAQASRNEVACIIGSVLHKISVRFMAPVIAEKSLDALKATCREIQDGNTAILKAVQEGSEDGASRAMKNYLDGFKAEFR